MPREIVLFQIKRFKLVLAFPWFLLIGWWVSLLVIVLAVILTLTIIGLPQAFVLIDRIPAIAIRKEPPFRVSTYESTSRRILRAVYFLCIGCWFTTLLIIVALWINYTFGLFGANFISDWMVSRAPSIATLSSS
jgi:uncharacterized membrane protein YccF (DUF307 family)